MTNQRRLFSFFALITIIGSWLVACTEDQPDSTTLPPLLTRPMLTLTDPVNVTVPVNAVVQRGGATGVFILQNQQARFRMVRIGKLLGPQRQILSGLHGNETLVLGDLTDVHDGSPVTEK